MQKPQLLSRLGKTDIMVKVPLVEIAGGERVLVENHLGVLGYSLNEIEIKVGYGKLSVLGANLRLMHLSKEQLVISGCIEAIRICKGRGR